LALELTDTLGLTLAETARQLGVSTAAISKIRKKAEKRVKNRRLIQKD
jgi:DNA-directed RNA polymerase specialized sigma subunit